VKQLGVRIKRQEANWTKIFNEKYEAIVLAEDAIGKLFNAIGDKLLYTMMEWLRPNSYIKTDYRGVKYKVNLRGENDCSKETDLKIFDRCLELLSEEGYRSITPEYCMNEDVRIDPDNVDRLLKLYRVVVDNKCMDEDTEDALTYFDSAISSLGRYGLVGYFYNEILNGSEEEFMMFNKKWGMKRYVEEYREKLGSEVGKKFLKSRNDRVIYNCIMKYLVNNSTDCIQESDDEDESD
jgi:hypothetical protein